jgi:hypothetical protein
MFLPWRHSNTSRSQLAASGTSNTEHSIPHLGIARSHRGQVVEALRELLVCLRCDPQIAGAEALCLPCLHPVLSLAVNQRSKTARYPPVVLSAHMRVKTQQAQGGRKNNSWGCESKQENEALTRLWHISCSGR